MNFGVENSLLDQKRKKNGENRKDGERKLIIIGGWEEGVSTYEIYYLANSKEKSPYF